MKSVKNRQPSDAGGDFKIVWLFLDHLVLDHVFDRQNPYPYGGFDLKVISFGTRKSKSKGISLQDWVKFNDFESLDQVFDHQNPYPYGDCTGRTWTTQAERELNRQNGKQDRQNGNCRQGFVWQAPTKGPRQQQKPWVGLDTGTAYWHCKFSLNLS